MSMVTSELSAAILAGGQARRFGGRDKSRVDIGGAPMIERQLRLLRTLTNDVLIVTNDPARYADLGVRIVSDCVSGAGALGGVYTALLASTAPRTLVVACDLPFLTAPFLHHLAAAAEDLDVVIPRPADGYQPLCACYARSIAGTIKRHIDAGHLKMTDFLKDVRVRELGPADMAPYDPDGVLFLNVNTPDDYARALTAAQNRHL